LETVQIEDKSQINFIGITTQIATCGAMLNHTAIKNTCIQPFYDKFPSVNHYNGIFISIFLNQRHHSTDGKDNPV